MTRIAVGMAVVAAMLSPHAAAAAPESQPPKIEVLLLPPRWTGPVPDTHKDAIRSGFAEALADTGHAILDDSGEPCASSQCRTERARLAEAELVVELVVTAVDRDYVLAASLYDGESGERVAEVTEPCKICPMAELATLARDHGLALRTKIAGLDATAPVVVESEPARARVRIDGELVGQTPLLLRLPAGSHEIQLELDGRVTVRRRLVLVGHVRERIDAVLPPLPRAPATAPASLSPRRARTKPGLIGGGSALLVAGLAAAGASAALFVLHGDVVDKRCDGLDVDFAGHCRYIRDTRSGAIVLTVVASSAVAAGIGLLVAGARGDHVRRSQRAARSAP